MKKWSLYLSGLSIALIVAFLNVEVYNEYFGNGPPYFDRTANMDKWSNPIPVLAIVDGAVLFVCWFAWRWANQARP